MNCKIKAEIVLIVIAVIAIIPFLLNAFYNHPSVDDYNYGIRFAEKSIWDEVKFIYLKWSGRYFGTFISILNPLIYDSRFLTIIYSIILILFTPYAVYYLVDSVCKACFNRRTIIAIASLILIAFLACMPYGYGFFYWFTGYITFSFSALFSFMLIGLAYKYLSENKTGYGVLIPVTLLSAIIAGSNEFSIIHLHAAAFVCFLIPQFRANKMFYIMYAILMLFSLVSILAPGNYARAEICDVHISIWEAMHISLYFTKEFFVRYAVMFIAVGLVYVTAFAPLYLQNPTKAKGVHPIIIALGFVTCLFILQLFVMYSTFSPIMNRTENSTVLFALFIWLWFLQSAYNCYIANRKLSKILENRLAKVISLLIFLVISFAPWSPITVAYKDIFTGESKAYSDSRLEHKEILENARGKDSVEISAFTSYPETLLPERREKQATITKLVYNGTVFYYDIGKIQIPNDTVKRHPIIRTKLWKYE